MYIYAENCKTEVEEVKYMKREREIMCSWIRGLNIIKMELVPKFVYRFNVIPVKISGGEKH